MSVDARRRWGAGDVAVAGEAGSSLCATRKRRPISHNASTELRVGVLTFSPLLLARKKGWVPALSPAKGATPASTTTSPPILGMVGEDPPPGSAQDPPRKGWDRTSLRRPKTAPTVSRALRGASSLFEDIFSFLRHHSVTELALKRSC